MSISNMRSMFAGAVAAMVVMTMVSGPMYAHAQITSTTVTEVPIESITPIDVGTITTAPTSTSSFGSMTVQCWRTTTFAGGSAARLQIPTAQISLYTDVVCWEVYSMNGGIASVPITSGPDFEPTAIQTASSGSDTATPASSSTNDNLAKILPAALIGSLFGLILLIFTTIYLIRRRNRGRSSQDSRARRWADRNSVAVRESWAMKETPPGFNGATKPETA